MSKKRKRRRRVSSSSEADEVSPERDVTTSHKSVKKRCGVKSQGNIERSSDEREKSTSSARKDDSQSPRQVRHHLSTLTKTQATKQSHVKKDICYAESRSVSGSVCSSKSKSYSSTKEKTLKGSKPEERTPSKLTYTEHRGIVPPPIKTYKSGSKNKSSRHSPSKSLKQHGTSSFVSAKQEERRRDAKKTESNAEVPLWTENNFSAVRTKGSPPTSSKDAAQQNREELDKKNRIRRQKKVLEDKKTRCMNTKNPSFSSTKMSSIVSKHTASTYSFEGLKKHTSASGVVQSDLQKTSESSSIQKQIHSPTPPIRFNFKIPKKIQKKMVEKVDEKQFGISTNTNLKNDIKLSDTKVVAVDSDQKTAEPVQSCLDVTPHPSFERPSTSYAPQSPVNTKMDTSFDQVHVIEQLYLARSEKRLEVNVMEIYGELTCMDIDPPEEEPAYTQRKEFQQDPILVLDTNILLSHLDCVKKISSEGLKGLGFPRILIPWVVLQELDFLKQGRGLSGSVAHLAIPAISFIYNSLRDRKPHIWGQSMQQAAETRHGLNAENNDDRVLQCCLQYQSLYPECALILCTNDKNLCIKALLSGVKALSNSDLKAEAERSQHDVHIQQHTQGLMPPYVKSQASSPAQRRSCSHVQPNVQETGGFSAGFSEKDTTQLWKDAKDGTVWDPSISISKFEDCLREVLSDVLEVEMKTIYEDLWTEIVFIKPPWTLQDVLKCFQKHWVAVFRYILPSSSKETIVNLINFFNSGNNKDPITTSNVLKEARELVEMFQERSNQVPRVLSVMDTIFTKPHHEVVEGESSTIDVMIDDDGSGSRDDEEAEEGKQSSTHQVSHQEVWAMFENFGTVVFQTSMEVFKALGFDTHTRQSAQPARDSAPPRDALVCLHKLSITVSQLLQGFSSVLSSTPDVAEVQTLLSIVQSNKIAGVDSSVTTKHILDCFLQPEYREKLQLGGKQLVDLQEALNCCIQANALNFTM